MSEKCVLSGAETKWTTSRRCLKTRWTQGRVSDVDGSEFLGCRGGVEDLLMTLLSFCCSQEACELADMRMLAPKHLSFATCIVKGGCWGYVGVSCGCLGLPLML